MARHYGGMKTRSSNNAQRRRATPAETQEVYLDPIVWSMATMCAAEFGMSIDDLANEAMVLHLKVKAGQLFERELHEAKMEADQGSVSLQRHEFEKTWRAPAWSKHQVPPPSP